MLLNFFVPFRERDAFNILENSINLVRIVCGLFFLPHAWAKMTQFQPHVEFFSHAGMNPAPFFVILALIIEVVVGVLFSAGILVRLTGLIGIAYLSIAAIADVKHSGLNWGWSVGGVEYPVFWALCILSVVISSFKMNCRNHN